MAKFKCIASGNIIEFIHEVDIKSTRRNKAYVEVVETAPQQQQQQQEQSLEEETPVVKKAGRPAKLSNKEE